MPAEKKSGTRAESGATGSGTKARKAKPVAAGKAKPTVAAAKPKTAAKKTAAAKAVATAAKPKKAAQKTVTVHPVATAAKPKTAAQRTAAPKAVAAKAAKPKAATKRRTTPKPALPPSRPPELIAQPADGPAAFEPPLPEPVETDPELAARLPETYDVTEIVCLPVDPQRVYTYWDISPETVQENAIRPDESLNIALFADGSLSAARDIPLVQRSLYLDIPPGAVRIRTAMRLRRDFGYRELAGSNEVELAPPEPIEAAGGLTDGGPDDPLGRIARIEAAGTGSLRERILSSYIVGRTLFAGLAPGAPEVGPRGLSLEVELVIRGRVNPGDRVTILDRDVPVEPDGSFVARVAVPAGRTHAITVRQIGPDGTVRVRVVPVRRLKDR